VRSATCSTIKNTRMSDAASQQVGAAASLNCFCQGNTPYPIKYACQDTEQAQTHR
jgi:hypothetical protein